MNVTDNMVSANSVSVINVLLCSNSTNKISGGGTNTSNNTVEQTSTELERVKVYQDFAQSAQVIIH